MNKCASIPARQFSARSAYMTVERLSDCLQWERNDGVLGRFCAHCLG